MQNNIISKCFKPHIEYATYVFDMCFDKKLIENSFELLFYITISVLIIFLK